MELLRHIPASEPVFKWGLVYSDYRNPQIRLNSVPDGNPLPKVLAVVSYPLCPMCKKFSYFCTPGGDFTKHAAILWMQSVIGFEPIEGFSTYAGIVTVACPTLDCGVAFGFPIALNEIDAYRTHCPSWPKAELAPGSGSPDQVLRIKLLRRFAKFPNAHLSDMEFIAEMELREKGGWRTWWLVHVRPPKNKAFRYLSRMWAKHYCWRRNRIHKCLIGLRHSFRVRMHARKTSRAST